MTNFFKLIEHFIAFFGTVYYKNVADVTRKDQEIHSDQDVSTIV